jgi:hypothetical protein
MANDAVGIAGILLIFVLSFFSMIACGRALVRTFRTGLTYDRQLGKVSREDNPNLFGLHILGFGLLTLVCVFIQGALIVGMVQKLFP